jgi:hypothetical protein
VAIDVRPGGARAGRFLQPSRPYLEWHVRTRVRALRNVEIIGECEAVRLVASGAQAEIIA